LQQDNSIKNSLKASDSLIERHIGPNEPEIAEMCKQVKVSSLDDLMLKTMPSSVYDRHALEVHGKEFLRETTEHLFLQQLKELAKKNKMYKNYLGAGYYGTILPGVIQRGILENPAWYTSYTPYQAEISQGRLESLLNFQTMVCELTGLDYANASLLDEATAAAEALFMAHSLNDQKKKAFFIASNCFPQTIEVAKTKADFLGVKVYVDDPATFNFEAHAEELNGVLLQCPDNFGQVHDYTDLIARLKKLPKVFSIIATDLLASTMIKSPGEMGADIAIGNSQRFGVPMGYGGPHAAFLATRDEHKRKMPGRVIGISKDVHGNPAFRMSMQTREQHIRREKATSNICTAQALLANIAASYAVYHGKEGLKVISGRVHGLAQCLAAALNDMHFNVITNDFFDTISLKIGETDTSRLISHFSTHHINLRKISSSTVGISIDETTTLEDIEHLAKTFASFKSTTAHMTKYFHQPPDKLNPKLRRQQDFMNQKIFNRIHSEHQMLRYLHYLQNKDLSLTKSMIPLGSCTMKLNATTEMVPVTWPEFANIHPFTPVEQVPGYQELLHNLEAWLKAVTKFDAFSLQPNSGAQGEYAGLLAIVAMHRANKQGHRNICLIPVSAHGTNPASAAMAGLKVVPVKSDPHGNIDLKDLKERAKEYEKDLAMMMVTYPSTHGVYEDTIKEAIKIVHEHGGQVYMDGANMNAQVGWTSPGFLGADVCHLNLHKTFAIPHGGGGPGMGPIGVKAHLAPFLPGHPIIKTGGNCCSWSG
jgi:glycine dehydrogenase